MSPAPSHPVLAATLGIAMWSLREVRQRTVAQARGRVLEVGVGTGMSLPHYRDVATLAAVEPDPHMLRRARRRAEKLRLAVELRPERAEALPFADASFDTVVATFVLCTIPDPARAIAEMHRVLAPGGRLLFAEHTRSRFGRVAGAQDRLQPLWSRMGGGCHPNRDSVALIRAQAPWREVQVGPVGTEKWTLFPVYAGVAHKA